MRGRIHAQAWVDDRAIERMTSYRSALSLPPRRRPLSRADLMSTATCYATLAGNGDRAIDDTTRAAFERLLRIARSDTGQSGRVADFILAWWNAGSLGGFDLTDLFAVDGAIADDMSTVFSWLARLPDAEYPNEYRAEIEEIIGFWRPDVLSATAADA